MPSDPQKQQVRAKVQTISLARREPEKEQGSPKVSQPVDDLWLDEADRETAGTADNADTADPEIGSKNKQSQDKSQDRDEDHRPGSSTGSPDGSPGPPRGRFRPQALWLRFQEASPRRKALAIFVVGLLGIGLFLAGHGYAQSVVDEAEVSVEQLMVLGTGIDSLQVRVTVLVINSSPHSATFQSSQLDVYYQGEKAGYFSVPELEYEPGENRFTLNLKLKQSARGPFAQLAAALISALEVQVQVKGTLQTVGFPWFELVVDKEVNVRVFTTPYV